MVISPTSRPSLAPGIHRIRRISRLHSTSTYHPKVHAYPFKLSPEQAVDTMGMWAALAARRVDRAMALVAPKLFSRRDPFQPDRMEAVYYPSWIVDAEVAVKTSGSRKLILNHGMTIQVKHTYVPGNALEPLSCMSFNTDRAQRLTLPAALPWDHSAESQHGLSIKCLPYTLTPFTIPAMSSDFQLHVGSHKVDNVKMQLKGSTLKFIAAYPVLTPLYLAQYYDVDGVPFTMILEAHSKYLYGTRRNADITQNLMQRAGVPPILARFFQGRIDYLAKTADDLGTVANGAVYEITAIPASPIDGVEVSGISTSLDSAVSTTFQREYRKWLDQSEAAWLASRAGTVDMDDLRVRPYSDWHLVQERMRLSQGANLRLDLTENLAQGEHTNQLQGMLHKKRAQMKEKIDELTPWWGEWEKQEAAKVKGGTKL